MKRKYQQYNESSEDDSDTNPNESDSEGENEYKHRKTGYWQKIQKQGDIKTPELKFIPELTELPPVTGENEETTTENKPETTTEEIKVEIPYTEEEKKIEEPKKEEDEIKYEETGAKPEIDPGHTQKGATTQAEINWNDPLTKEEAIELQEYVNKYDKPYKRFLKQFRNKYKDIQNKEHIEDIFAREKEKFKTEQLERIQKLSIPKRILKWAKNKKQQYEKLQQENDHEEDYGLFDYEPTRKGKNRWTQKEIDTYFEEINELEGPEEETVFTRMEENPEKTRYTDRDLNEHWDLEERHDETAELLREEMETKFNEHHEESKNQLRQRIPREHKDYGDAIEEENETKNEHPYEHTEGKRPHANYSRNKAARLAFINSKTQHITSWGKSAGAGIGQALQPFIDFIHRLVQEYGMKPEEAEQYAHANPEKWYEYEDKRAKEFHEWEEKYHTNEWERKKFLEHGYKFKNKHDTKERIKEEYDHIKQKEKEYTDKIIKEYQPKYDRPIKQVIYNEKYHPIAFQFEKRKQPLHVSLTGGKFPKHERVDIPQTEDGTEKKDNEERPDNSVGPSKDNVHTQ